MRPIEDIEKLVKKLRYQSSEERRQKIFDNAAAVLDDKQKSAEPQPNIWRIIMRSRITKFAVAAVIIIGVLIGINQFGGSIDGTTTVYAMSDVPELMYTARTIHMRGVIYNPDTKNPGQFIPADAEILIDLENERWRNKAVGMIKDQDGTQILQTESIFDGGEVELNLNHNKKTASYSKVGEYDRKRNCQQAVNTIMYFTCSNTEMLDMYKVVGQEKIDGHMYEIWELVIDNPDPMAMSGKMQSWLSPETGDIAQVLIWMRDDDNEWFKAGEITTLDFNIEVSNEDFQMSAPSGYEYINTIDTANENVFAGVSCGTGEFILEGHLLLAMKDGSMIACWSARKYQGDISQGDYFTNLEFGGKFPQLPCVVEALKASANGHEAIYEGYYLGYTQRNGRFYVWGIYITTDPIESPLRQILPYEILYKTDGKKDASCRLNKTVDMPIENAGDFDDFVLGAMRQLSDDSTAPEYLTYQAVQELSEQIKSSIE